MRRGRGCDFCGALRAHWVLVSRDPRSPAPPDWLACSACWPFIRDGDRAGLVERAVDVGRADDGSRDVIAQLHARFWRGYRGGGRYVD